MAKTKAEIRREILNRSDEVQEIDWDELDAIERDNYYFYEKITGIPVTEDFPAMKLESFKEAVHRDPNFKKADEVEDGCN